MTLGAQESDASSSFAVNMDTGLRELYTALNSDEVISFDPEALFVIDGIVSAREVERSRDEGFVGFLVLTAGQWLSNEQLVSYRCAVRLEGDQFAPLIPERRSRQRDPRALDLNTPVLVFGEFLGYSEGADGEKLPVLLARSVRKIDF